VLVLGAEGPDQPTDDAVHGLLDLFLLVLPFEQGAAKPVDGLALLVHDVVVLEQVFAGLEVLGFPGLLRGLDALRDQLRLDGDALFHPQLQHELRDALAGEDAEQVVLEREVEARRAWVALSAGEPTQLIVDAAGCVWTRALY